MSLSASALYWLPLVAGALGPRPQGVAFWLVVASIGAANAVFHLWATWRGREHSPGVVTGLVAYLPLAVYGFVHFARSGQAAAGTLVQALLIGPAYHFYAAWNHRRRARALGTD